MELAEFLKARLDEDEKRAHFFETVPKPKNPRSDWYTLQSPARMLREVAAKRAILADYAQAQKFGPSGAFERGYDDGRTDALEAVLRHLAAVWSDHPDYRAEWKP